MRIMPRAQREAMFEIYSFCRARRRHRRRSRAARAAAARQLERWRADIAALYGGHAAAASERARARHARFRSRRTRIFSPSSTAWRWTSLPTSARPTSRRSIFIATASPARSAGCRCACSAWNASQGLALAHHLGRALQMTNILRDLDEDATLGRLYLPREALRDAGIAGTDPATVLANPMLGEACASIAERAESALRRGRRDHGAKPAPGGARAAHHGEAYRHMLDRMVARGLAAPRAPVRLPRWQDYLDRAAQSVLTRSCDEPHRPHHRRRACRPRRRRAALPETASEVVVHEATAFAGGRCRSYHDAALGMMIDNGNHLLLSGNRAALGYLDDDRRRGPPGRAALGRVSHSSISRAEQRWTLRINDGRVPWWIFDPARRVPGTRARDYLALLRLLRPPPGKTIGEIIDCQGPLYRPAGRAALARGAQYRSAARLGEACRRGDPRNAGRRRPRLPAAVRARRLVRDIRRAGAGAAATARRAGRLEHQLRTHPLRRRTASTRSISAARRSRLPRTTPSSSRCRPMPRFRWSAT